MKIISSADDKTFTFLKENGIQNPIYVGLWNSVVNNLLLDSIKQFNWDSVTVRDFETMYEMAKLNPMYNEIEEITHTSSFSNKSNVKWKIINANQLDTDLTHLYSKLSLMFTEYKIWVTRIDPGCYIPQHVDTVDAFINDFSIPEEEIKNIKRLAILPEDIKPWHHLWYGNTILSEGKQGDVWSFNFWTPHGGSNLGPEPKYTIQVIAI